MPRIARVVAPGFPYHITQRGNRRQETFFSEDDYRSYISLMAEWCSLCEVEVWAYCLMPNHVHLIGVPKSEDSLRRAIGEAHRRYTRRVNFREGWRGQFCQGRFASYPWSSASAHLSRSDDSLVKVSPLLEIVGNWQEFLSQGDFVKDAKEIRRHERTGRPLGNRKFIVDLEKVLGRNFQYKKPGPKSKNKA